MPAFWVGIDSGKRAHHCVAIDQKGTVLLSRRAENDEGLLPVPGRIVHHAAGTYRGGRHDRRERCPDYRQPGTHAH